MRFEALPAKRLVDRLEANHGRLGTGSWVRRTCERFDRHRTRRGRVSLASQHE